MRWGKRGLLLIPLILIGILAIDAYVTEAFYTVCFAAIEMAGKDVWEVIEGHDFLLDTFVCILLTAIYLPWYYFGVRGEPSFGGNVTAPAEKRGWRRPAETAKWVVIVLGMGGIATLWLWFVEDTLYNAPVFGESMESFTDTWSGIENESYFWVFLSVVLIGPVMEELLFRGLIYGYLERIRGGWLPVLVSAAAFGIWHGEPVQMVYTAIMGLALGLARKKTGSLWLPIWMHILNNLLSTLPPPLETDWMYGAIEILDLLMVLPGLIFFIMYAREKSPENKPDPGRSRSALRQETEL